MSERIWEDFKGEINNVVVSQDGSLFFVFTSDKDCPVYLIYKLAYDYYSLAASEKFNNVEQYYLQDEFKTSYKIFSLFYKEGMRVHKVRMNLSDNRLIVLYQHFETKKTHLKIFEIKNSRPVHNMKINLICSISLFRDMEVTDFELRGDIDKMDNLLLLWNDRILSKTYVNVFK
jgi:hypothetical protein